MPFFRDYEFDATWMFLLGIIILVGVVLRRVYSRFQRRSSRFADFDTTRTERLLKKSTLMDAPAEVLKWQVEMHEVARDLKAELDSKMLALQSLMAQANAQESRLAELVRESRRLSAAGPHSDETRRKVYRLFDEGVSPGDIAIQIGLATGEVEFILRLRRTDEPR